MPHEVVLTADAESDIEDIVSYIAQFDSVESAEHVLDRLLRAADNLAVSPERGSPPKELRDVGDQQYRQVIFKPYRLIYRVTDRQVIVYVISDGHRDFQTLLTRRLLRTQDLKGSG